MEWQINTPLAPLTTFKIGGSAAYFGTALNTEDLQQGINFAKTQNLPLFILGGGSNILVSDNGFPGAVVLLKLPGQNIIKETTEFAWLKINAGQNWDSVVDNAVNRGLLGIENLSHIPGSAGGFIVQNVGAYGQEASQVVHEVIALERATGNIITFNNEECAFLYRKSSVQQH